MRHYWILSYAPITSLFMKFRNLGPNHSLTSMSFQYSLIVPSLKEFLIQCNQPYQSGSFRTLLWCILKAWWYTLSTSKAYIVSNPSCLLVCTFVNSVDPLFSTLALKSVSTFHIAGRTMYQTTYWRSMWCQAWMVDTPVLEGLDVTLLATLLAGKMSFVCYDRHRLLHLFNLLHTSIILYSYKLFYIHINSYVSAKCIYT